MSEIAPYAFGLLGVVITALVTLYGQKVLRRTNRVTETLTERRDTIADRDSMIAGLRSDVAELRKEMNTQKQEMTDLRGEVESVRDHNNALITYCYKLINVIRRNGLADELPSPPPSGIHI